MLMKCNKIYLDYLAVILWSTIYSILPLFVGTQRHLSFIFPLSFKKGFIKICLISNNFLYFVFEAVWRIMQNCNWQIPGWLFRDQAERLISSFSDLSNLALTYLGFLVKLTLESDFSDLMRCSRTTRRPGESQGKQTIWQ